MLISSSGLLVPEMLDFQLYDRDPILRSFHREGARWR
jgi:hypothetical protein